MGKVVNVECALRDIFHVSHRSSQNLKGILLLLYLSKSERPYVHELLIVVSIRQQGVGGSESRGFFTFIEICSCYDRWRIGRFVPNFTSRSIFEFGKEKEEKKDCKNVQKRQ